MVKFITKRLIYGFLVLLGAVIAVFFLFNVLPGDPVNLMVGSRSDVSTRENITKELGLDKPLYVQLGYYMNDLSPISIHEDNPKNASKYEYNPIFSVGDHVVVFKAPYLRRSFQNNKKVSEIIWENLEGTFWLAFAAMTFATFFGILFGLLASLKQNSLLDHSMITISTIGVSAPSFVIAAMVSMIFGYYLGDYTGLNISGQLWDYDLYGRKLVLKNLILPAFALGLRPLSIIVQLTRSSMLEVLSQDYIRTARAKGLGKFKIIVKHALKNALNPVITAVSGWLASLMAGAFFIEVIFDWKGLGLVTIQAVETLDFPVVMGTTLFIAVVFIFVNIFVDILYAAIDPRVRLE
ncbi:ABC transporter permease [Cytophagaceae bacterium ABcell3]|nr:ABC transporter permease [Cytophagaceae bacterium ABcell3]